MFKVTCYDEDNQIVLEFYTKEKVAYISSKNTVSIIMDNKIVDIPRQLYHSCTIEYIE